MGVQCYKNLTKGRQYSVLNYQGFKNQLLTLYKLDVSDNSPTPQILTAKNANIHP
jgi:hypothetical protein